MDNLQSLVLQHITLIWLVLESGQFFQNHLLLDDNPLFWPFWVSLSISVFLALKLLSLKSPHQ